MTLSSYTHLCTLSYSPVILIIFHIISTCCRPPSSHHINDHAFLEDLTKDSVFDHLNHV